MFTLTSVCFKVHEFPVQNHALNFFSMITQIIQSLKTLQKQASPLSFRKAQALYLNGQCQLLTMSNKEFEFIVDDEFGDFILQIQVDEEVQIQDKKGKEPQLHHAIACLMQLSEEMERTKVQVDLPGKAYTREGMIRRVLKERKAKALNAEYKVAFADNIYGEHELTNEKGQVYKITFRDLKKQKGYCSCMDYRTNKLGTCKHLMFAFEQIKTMDKKLPRGKYPFVEIHLDPLHDYRIGWFYIGEPEAEIKALLTSYFGTDSVLAEDKVLGFLDFLQEASRHKQILIRPEVYEYVEKEYDRHALERIRETYQIDLSRIRASLYPYQQKGVEFAAFREGVIIADEMGLGKTLQAIATAVVKKEVFGFERCLIICPASLKNQWKQEIEKFSYEKAEVIEGLPTYRRKRYLESDAYFLIVNYETVLRDKTAINQASMDFIVLDEAQRIKNYDTLTARAVKALKKKHGLIITGTPIENRLIDLFSLMDFIDPYMLTPLWEFSYQHCYFDTKLKNKITGYYNLQQLRERLSSILLRREKREVIKELPHITEVDVPVQMSWEQREYHSNAAMGVAAILRKKFITPYDMNRLMLLLNQMRMACDSTFLIDKETHISPKLEELRHILVEKMDLTNSDRKVIIFSEWVRMNGIIGKMLREHGIPYVELSGKVPVKNRQKLVNEFQNNPRCKVFLSSEAGGAGLNLQAADTVINFELPWNPAKKNQRIGRIDRLGQRADHLTVINLITRNSIEMRIATGLELKQSLFDSVLSPGNHQDIVDFSEKGRAQFLKQLQDAIEELSVPEQAEGVVVEEELVEEMEAFAAESPQQPLSTSAQTQSKTSPTNADKGETQQAVRVQEMETVMNQGLDFLSGLFKMATGKDLGAEGKRIEIDAETGEVVMRFKLPV